MLNKSIRLAVLPLALLTAACTLVQAVPGADKVTLVQPEHITQCKLLGSTKTSVLEKSGIIERNRADVLENLVALAKNGAVDMGGDTIVAGSPVEDGKQLYHIYKCRK